MTASPPSPAGTAPPAERQPDLLAAIVAGTRRTVEVREARESRAELERRAAAVPRLPGRFLAALAGGDRPRIIAECKRRSPSRGVLRREGSGWLVHAPAPVTHRELPSESEDLALRL